VASDDPYDSLFGATYSAYMERPRLGRLVGRLVWGGDPARYYESMAAVGEVPAGGTVVDCPCGAGPALRAVPADGSVRYVGADLSPAMLRRARRRAAERGLVGVELLTADACDLPLPDGSADLFVSFWGLHCFEDPSSALAEAARVLKPDGRLLGAALVRGREGLRQRLLIKSGRAAFGRVGTAPQVQAWLSEAGFAAQLSRSGPMLFFDAARSA
jgi:ubiquinone/menaquinone biosynthesis C-methylase UbiE